MTTYPMKLTCTKCGATDEGTLHIEDAPAREWVGLTDEEIRRTDHHKVDGAYDYSFKQGARWAEAKLKEKNT